MTTLYRLTFRSACLLVVLGALTVAPTAFAGDGDEGDIGLRIESGKIVTTVVTDTGFGGPEERVFEGELGELEGDPGAGGDPDIFTEPITGAGFASFVTNAPGFDSAAGTWDTGSRLGIKFVDLTEFNGSELVSTAVDLQASFGSSFIRTDDTGSASDPATLDGDNTLLLPVFTSGVGEQDSGRWHRHYVFALFEGIDGGSGDLLAPSDGVYVLEAMLRSTDPTIADSDSFFIVFGVNADPDPAIEFLESQTEAIPTPSAAGMILVSGVLAAMRRRRR